MNCENRDLSIIVNPAVSVSNGKVSDINNLDTKELSSSSLDVVKPAQYSSKESLVEEGSESCSPKRNSKSDGSHDNLCSSTENVVEEGFESRAPEESSNGSRDNSDSHDTQM
jgi:hypothetical protein